MPGAVSTIPPFEPDSNTPAWNTFDISDGSGGFFSYEALVNEVELLYGPGTPIPQPPDGYLYEFVIVLVYPPYCNSTTQTIQMLDTSGNPIPSQITDLGPASNTEFYPNGLGGYVLIYPSNIDNFNIFEGGRITLTASNACSSETGDAQTFCFLAGSPVALENGSTKPIEEIVVGDRVIGAFGEINTVTGTISSTLGFVPITNINGEHKTTAPHPHIAADHTFCCSAPGVLKFTYGKQFPITGADGTREKRVIKGVNPERIAALQVGTVLQSLTGPRPVTSLETIRMPPATRVYHLTTDGSHSYTVDGYAVAGGATEDDFNYDTWTPK